MGKHARGATRSRVPIATVVLGLAIVGVIAGGSWLGSTSLTTPASSNLTTGAAVVLSSLACNDGAGGTLLDVRSPMGGSAARATLEGCGYQVGQQLAVQYPVDDPTQVSLAGTVPTADAGLEQSPLGILAAGLLAVGAAVAVWAARRRSTGKGVAVQPPALLGMVGDPSEHPGVGRHARRDPVDTNPVDTNPVDTNPVDTDSADEPAPGRLAAPARSGAAGSTSGQLPSVDLVFPFASSLAASLRDELFTHRSLPT